MNESLFTHGAFDSARPLGRPDFEVMMTLASLRQVNSPTARLAMMRTHGGAEDADCALTILAGLGGSRLNRDGIASFYDLTHLATNDGWPLPGSERVVNLGISTYVQFPDLNATDRPQVTEVFEDI